MKPYSWIIFLLFTAGVWASPDDPLGETPRMDRSIADARIQQAIHEETSLDEQLKLLRDVIERCDTPNTVALANYNLGTLLLSHLDDDQLAQDAIDGFRDADRRSDDLLIRIQSRENLAHLFYQLAHNSDDEMSSQQPADPEEILATLKASVSHLRQAADAFGSVLELDRSRMDAAKNLERVRIEIQQLEDQIKQIEDMIEQQRQQQQQQQQDMADKLDELAKEQQGQADQTSESPPESQDQQSEQRDAQEKLSEETQRAQEELGEQDAEQSQSEKREQVEQKIEEAKESQKKAQEAMKSGDQESAAQSQQQAADALKEAAQRMQEIADESKKQSEEKQDDGAKQGQEQGQEGDSPPDEDESDAQQGDEISEIAKELLEKERQEREMRQVYRATGKPTKVEKDW